MAELLSLLGSGWASWAGMLAPVILLHTILFVTAIPPTGARALASPGADHRRYQRTTSPFVSWRLRRDPDVPPREP